MQIKRPRWTKREEKVLLKAIKDNPECLDKAWEAASYVLSSRSPKACSLHWYVELSKKTAKKPIIITGSGNKAIINRKNNSNVFMLRAKKNKKKSFIKYILDYFK